MGQTIQKNAFLQIPPMLPPEMNTYVYKILTLKEPEHFRAICPICIQDPFDLSHNLTKACQPYLLTKLKKMCELTFQHLKNIQ